MKVIVMSKTTLDVVQYDSVTSIVKAGTTITIAYGSASTATVNATTHIVRIMES